MTTNQQPRLKIVWNRDSPRYQLEIKGFSITKSSERECYKAAIDALERGLVRTKARMEKLGQ